jgi:hypothetical protein
MCSRVGLEASEKRKILLPLGIESRMSSLQPVAIPTKKKRSWPYLRYFLGNIMGNLSVDSRSPDRYIN